MEYRKLGRTGLDVSVIGLGTEHLICDRREMDSVLTTAVEAGVNYIDLLYLDAAAYGYDTDFWDNFGPALRSYRDKLILAAHWGSGPRYDIGFCQRCFEDILNRVGYAEVAMMTMVDDQEKWGGWINESIDILTHYKEKGLVGYIGGSGHGGKMLTKAHNSGLFDVLMFPINIISDLDEERIALCQACVERNVGLVAMKPYGGGGLLVVEGKRTSITPTQCLSYVLSLLVSTTVPGVKNTQEMRATLHYLEATDEEKDYSSAISRLKKYVVGQCLYCNHCLPCPQEINISQVILLVDWAKGGVNDWLRKIYAKLEVKASDCIECGECIERCPFDVDVIAKMQKAVEFFEVNAK